MKNANRTSNTIATILLVALLSSTFLPATMLSASAISTKTSMVKTEDIFGGSFSSQEIVAAPDETFAVAFSLCPTKDAPNTVVSFVLPADLVTLASGSQVWTGDLKKGETLTLTLSLAANGEVEAYVKADVEASSSGKNYQSSYYLHVVTSSLGINSNSLSSSMKAGSIRTINLQYVSTALTSKSSRALGSSVAPLSTSGTFEVKGRFTYLNEDGGTSSARYMQVRVRDNNDGGFSVTQWTNGTGYFDFVIQNSASGRSPIVDLIAEGEWDWRGQDGNGAQYWWSTGVLATNVADGWVWTNYGLSPGNNNDILQAGDAVYAEAQMIYDWTAWARSKVNIHWPYGNVPSDDGDTIYLPLKTTSSWDHISVQHEEAHCIMWALYGSWPTGSGPSPHYIWSESSNGFALREGWAEFMECAVDNTPNNIVDYYNGHGGNMETNDWFNCVTNGNMDGVIVEGSVASILWDIYDGVNIAGDNDHMAWGLDEIFTVIKDDKPQSMFDFWNDWAVRWPDNSTSKGPLCDIYYQYGIDEDWFNPWGSVSINGGATYTNSRTVTLALNGDDWGVGVKYMRFSEDNGVTWGGWNNYAPTFTYTITSPNDGWKYVDVQFADLWWLSAAGTIYDGIALDTTPPTGTIQTNNGTTYATSRAVTLNLTATDNYSGVHYMRFSENMGAWGSWVPFATTYNYTLTTPNDGTKGVDVQFQDYAGCNSTIWGIWDYIYLDTTKPTGTALINNGSIATTSTSVYLNLTYTDTGSGISKIRFGNTGDPWSAWETPSPTKAWTIPPGDGTKYVWCQVIDNAGLISDQFYDAIILDTVNPTGSIVVGLGNPTYTTTTGVTLYLTYADSGSGVYQVRYGNSGGSWSAWEAPAATKAWTLLPGDEAKTVFYQTKDNAGLTSAIYSDSIVLDATPPAGSIVVGNGNPTYTNTTSVTLHLFYYDESGSGVYQVRYENSGGSWSAWEAPAATKAWTLSSGDGSKTVYYQIKDNAGNSQQFNDGIVLDTTAPTGTVSINSGAAHTTSRTVTLTLSASDATSGVAKVRFSENTGAWTQWYAYSTTFPCLLNSTGDGTKFIDVQFNDTAGNPTTAFTIWDSITLDTTAPTGSIVINSGDPATTTTTAVTLYLTYSDATSGVYQVRYSNDGTWDTEPWEAPSPTKAWTLTGDDGHKTVHYQIKDNAGLTNAYSDSIILQTAGGNAAYLVVRGYNNGIYCKVYNTTTASWDDWTELPGSTVTPPAAAIIGNELHIVVRGSNFGQIWHGYINLDTDAFSGFTLLDGATPSAPTLTANGTHLCLAVRGDNDGIYYRFYPLATRIWGSWNAAPSGTTVDTPAVVLVGNNLHISVRGSVNDQIWFSKLVLPSGTFSGWTLLSGTTPSTPVLTSNSTHLCLVVRGSNNGIYYRWCTIASDAWTDWIAFAFGSTPDTPAATITGENLQIVVRGMSNDAIWHGTLNLLTSEWSGWTQLDGATPSKPVLAS